MMLFQAIHRWFTRRQRWEAGITAKIDFLITRQNLDMRRQEHMAKTLDDLLTQVTAARALIQKNTDLEASLVTLINSNTQTISDLRAQLAEAGTDKTKLAALGDAMDQLVAAAQADVDQTVAAVTSNTPAAEPEPQPETGNT